MTREAIDHLLAEHFAAEAASDVERTMRTFTDDVVHDVVGRPENPLHGKAAVRVFYENFFDDVDHERLVPIRRLYGPDHVLDDMIVEGRATGRPFGLVGGGRPLRFRVLHVFQFRNGLIARENAWADIEAIRQQLA